MQTPAQISQNQEKKQEKKIESSMLINFFAASGTCSKIYLLYSKEQGIISCENIDVTFESASLE